MGRKGLGIVINEEYPGPDRDSDVALEREDRFISSGGEMGGPRISVGILTEVLKTEKNGGERDRRKERGGGHLLMSVDTGKRVGTVSVTDITKKRIGLLLEGELDKLGPIQMQKVVSEVGLYIGIVAKRIADAMGAFEDKNLNIVPMDSVQGKNLISEKEEKITPLSCLVLTCIQARVEALLREGR